MSEDKFQKALALLREDVERELDSIHDDVVRAGLSEEQEDTVMQFAYAHADSLQAKWVGKLRAMFGH